MKRIKTITSHVGVFRWLLSETSGDPIAWQARCQANGIPSPYAFGPTKAVYDWNGRAVVYFEVRHKRFEIYEVPASMMRFATDEEAADYEISQLRKSA